MTTCFPLPDCFSACKTTQELPVTQLARHVDQFHLVITDNQRPETPSLPHGLALPTRPTPQFSQVATPWSWGWRDGGSSPVVWTNKSFLSTRGVVLIQQYLTSGAETWEKLTGHSGCSLGLHVLPSPEPRLLNWPHMPPDCGFQTLLSCQLFHPSLASVFHGSLPDLLLRLGKCHPPAKATRSAWSWSRSYARYASPVHRGTHCLAWGRMANRLGHFLLDSNLGRGRLPLGTHLGDTPTLISSILLSLPVFLLSA
jgi:hypothetical protein